MKVKPLLDFFLLFTLAYLNNADTPIKEKLILYRDNVRVSIFCFYFL